MPKAIPEATKAPIRYAVMVGDMNQAALPQCFSVRRRTIVRWVKSGQKCGQKVITLLANLAKMIQICLKSDQKW